MESDDKCTDFPSILEKRKEESSITEIVSTDMAGRPANASPQKILPFISNYEIFFSETMNVLPFFLLISLILPCFCSGLLQCKFGMYNNAGFAFIQIENCTEKEEYCSAVSCVKGDLVIMTWSCEKHNNCTKIAERVSDANTTCRCKMGKKGVNLSNEKLSFLPEAPAVTTEANVGLCLIPTILFSVPMSIGIGITLLFLTTGVDYRFSDA